jgi:hypothetical protein
MINRFFNILAILIFTYSLSLIYILLYILNIDPDGSLSNFFIGGGSNKDYEWVKSSIQVIFIISTIPYLVILGSNYIIVGNTAVWPFLKSVSRKIHLSLIILFTLGIGTLTIQYLTAYQEISADQIELMVELDESKNCDKPQARMGPYLVSVKNNFTKPILRVSFDLFYGHENGSTKVMPDKIDKFSTVEPNQKYRLCSQTGEASYEKVRLMPPGTEIFIKNVKVFTSSRQ